MKIVLFSDIHANLPALEAFLNEMENHQPDAIYCLGDLVGYNIWPNEVVEEIRNRRIPTITGNYDFGIGRSTDDCGCAYKTEQEKANGQISISYTNQAIHEKNREYLRTLPSHIRVEFQLADHRLNLLLVHGSPRKVNEYLFEDRDKKSLLRILKDANADILCFGHTHKPYHRTLEDRTDGLLQYRHAINIGSVGKPKDGDPRGGFVILTLDETSSVFTAESIKVQFVRFQYNVERSATAIEQSPLPDLFAENLRTGR